MQHMPHAARAQAGEGRLALPPAPRPSYANYLLVVVILLAVAASAVQANVSLWAPFAPENQRAIARFVAGLFPPELSPDFLRLAVGLVRETLAISIVGTALAVVAAVPLALAALRIRGEEVARDAVGTGAWAARWALYYVARTVLNLARAVPELVWALIFVVGVGLGPFAGVLALATHSAGVLGKLYAELLESVDQRLVESGRSTGVTEAIVTAYVRAPTSLPVLLSYTLFRWECNMRAATVLGFVGAGGIGAQLSISTKLFAYHEVLTLIGTILALITLVDIAGQIIRARLLDAPDMSACRPDQRPNLVRRIIGRFGSGAE